MFCSDPRNDLSLLEAVAESVAVAPDPWLQRHAAVNGWRVLELMR